MNEPERTNEPQDESVVNDQQPMSSKSATWVGNLALGFVGFAVATLFLLPLAERLLNPGYPATRSEQLERERRMGEIEQAERELVVHDQVHANR